MNEGFPRNSLHLFLSAFSISRSTFSGSLEAIVAFGSPIAHAG